MSRTNLVHETLTTEDTEKNEYIEFWLVSVSHARSPRAAYENATPLHVSSPSLLVGEGVGGWGVNGPGGGVGICDAGVTA